MPKPSTLQHPAILFRALLLAAVGQLFLAQSGEAWTLYPGLLIFGAALWVFSSNLEGLSAPKEAKPLSLRVELLFFFLILAVAFGFRIYNIDSLPAGMHTDQGLTGLSALRILHEGWRPFSEVFDYQVPELLLFYQLAAWFGLVGSSYFTFHLFFILLSLAAFPFVYWAFRQWAGQSTALFSLFILAVMRWNWIETRNGYPSIQVLFYLFGAIAFWAYWRKSGKAWSLFLSALFVGTGFYSYQAFKIVPLLMVLYAAYEFFSQKRKGPSLRPFVVYFLMVFILILPLLAVMAQKGILGHREADLFIGTNILQEHSLKPLWDVWTGTLLMFNRAGDMNPRHNLPGHRMLDDVTAVFFILGLALAWRRRKEPGFFYPLVGFGIMSLTGLLSTDPAHSNRLVSLTPFVAYFAGTALFFFWNRAKEAFHRPVVVGTLGAVLLAVMTILNAHTYFVEQANNPECQNAFGIEQNFIGQNIEHGWKAFPGQNRYFVPASYINNHTVSFLTYPARGDVAQLNLRDWAAGRVPGDKPCFIFLDGGEKGILEFLKVLYPRIMVLPYQDQTGNTLISLGFLRPDAMGHLKPWERGLKGTYINSSNWNAKPVTVQKDPLLNFVSKFDFPFTNFPPFRIRWSGTMDIPQTGDYQFQVLTTDPAQVWLDGKLVPLEKPLKLSAGAHALRLDFEKDSGGSLALDFIWEKPGDDKWEVVPATAFGKIRP